MNVIITDAVIANGKDWRRIERCFSGRSLIWRLKYREIMHCFALHRIRAFRITFTPPPPVITFTSLVSNNLGPVGLRKKWWILIDFILIKSSKSPWK